MEESKTGPMSEQHGATPVSNRGGGKDGRGRTPMPGITLLIPNYKAKHRSKGQGIVWKYELNYWQNRWYVVGRPRYRRLMQRIGLRK
jgi:hypothetical protein